MEAESRQQSNCIAIESNKTDDIPSADEVRDDVRAASDDSGDQQLNKVIVISLRVMLIGFSAVYLCYEGIRLIRLYHNYDTVVAVSYQTSDSVAIPSLTLCLPTIIDKNKLLSEYPDLGPNLSQLDTEDKRRTLLTDYLEKALESESWTRLTIEEEQVIKCTLNYWSIGSEAERVQRKSTESPIGQKCREVVKPIASYSKAKTKCFTYFSKLSAEQTFSGMSSGDTTPESMQFPVIM